ncbi:Helix-turn-helix domain-containing protein [Thermostaphylospora chromogena]|uniref:Helix-turn-helix domain-containing protein n=2 Tax=Thermostaphylospora chromogena TaxID=35622 RepID=A0A1H1EYR2_9ACTN|nr:Helix-turn-helix domain-containing protein [Thermostaphylospora chromogena]
MAYNSTLGRRQLAERLRRLRLESGLSIDDVAEKLMCSASKISRLETGKRGAVLKDVRDLCQIYGAVDQMEELLALARESRRPGFRHEYGDLRDDTLYPYIQYEEQASRIIDFQTCYVPALLQTEAYARALVRGVLPEIDEEVLVSRVAVRMQRQKLLTKSDGPTLTALIHESVLHHRVGGVTVMREQLDRIIEAAALPSVTVRLIPFTAGATMGFVNTFVLLDLPLSSPPSLVYLEGLTGADYLEKPKEIAVYREAVKNITEKALDPAESIDRIARLREVVFGEQSLQEAGHST